MAKASVPEASGTPLESAGPTLVAGQKRPAESTDLVDDEESPKGMRKRKKSRSRKGSDASAPESLEEGEITEPNTSSNPSRPDSAASENAPAGPPGRWNTGVGSGLRISFGAKADKAPSRPASGRTESRDTQPPAASTSSPVDDWQWPPHSLISFQKPPRGKDSTEVRFSRWYLALAEANKTREDIKDPALVKEAWSVWLQRHPEMQQKWVRSAEIRMASVLEPKAFPAFLQGLADSPPEAPKAVEEEQATGLRVKGRAAAQRAEREAATRRAREEAAAQRSERKAASQRAKEEADARRAEEKAAPRRAEEEAAAQLEKPGDDGSPLEEGEILAPGPEEQGTSLTAEEIRYLRTYFPGVNPREAFCVSCAEYGHYQVDCKPCSVCNSWTHRDNQCHTLWRCERCDQTGHGKEACQAKLAAAPEKRGTCHFCQLPHNERQCPLLSQSYVFDPARAHKIKALTPSCYHCGGRGHYGAQCPSNPQRLPDALPSAAETWTMQNLAQYLDADSEDFGIEGAGRPPSHDRDAPSAHAPRKHVFFEEADDDEDDNEPFLRPSVQKQAQPRHMSSAPGRTMFSGPPGTDGDSSFYPPPPPPPPPPPASSLPPLPSGPPPPRQQRGVLSSRGRGGGGSNRGG